MDLSDRECAILITVISVALIISCFCLAFGIDAAGKPEAKTTKAESCIYIREAAICRPRQTK